MSLKIRHKLFAAMILANLLVIGGIFVLISFSFSQSFKDYLDATRLERLTPMAQELAQQYSQNGNWNWLRGRRNESWRVLMEKYIIDEQSLPPRLQQKRKKPRHYDAMRPDNYMRGGPLRNQAERLGGPQGNRPPPLRPGHKVLLADATGSLVVGRIRPSEEIAWIDIRTDGQLVGKIGFVKTKEITSELDQLFVDKLNENLLVTVLSVIFVSAIIALILSRALVAPILRLREAANKMTHGELETQLAVKSEDEIGQLGRDFNLLSRTLRDNLQSRQQWIADISHELRTPVAILQGEIEALQDGIRLFNQASIDSLYQEVKRLSLLINDLHELSLSDSGAMSYQFTRVDLVSIVNKALELKREKIAQCHIQVKHHQPNEPIIVNGDSHRLLQLFLNLLNNSLAYTATHGKIGIDYHVRQDALEIEWFDSEPGVSDESLALLFERLYRVDSSRSRNTGGSGLGLSIVKSIVSAHQGSIKAIHSELGGVKVIIRFPHQSKSK